MLMAWETVALELDSMEFLLGLQRVRFFLEGGRMSKDFWGISSRLLAWSKAGNLETWTAKATGRPFQRGAFSAVSSFLKRSLMCLGQLAYTSSSWQHSAKRRASSGLANAKSQRSVVSCC